MMNEIAEGVYVEQGFAGGNCGLILSQRGPVLVDSPMLPPDGRQWQLDMMSTGLDSVYAIANTDYHPEHFFGNHVFMPARVFGHEEAIRPLEKYDESTLEEIAEPYRKSNPGLVSEIMAIPIGRPELSVSDRLILHLG